MLCALDGSLNQIASRAVENLASFADRTTAEASLERLAGERCLAIEEVRDIRYAFVERRGSRFPSREEFFVAAPDFVATKARYGIKHFDEKWSPAQELLFA